MKSFKLHNLLAFIILLMISSTLNAQIEDIPVGATTRQMLVYAPPGIQENSPLLLSLHGLNQDINYQKNQTQWETVANAHGFVVVYPAGINKSWDLSGTSDTDFILAIIDEMADRYNIDRNRVYLSGFSMGGMMTYHAATKIADKIAAFAPVSGYLMGGPITNSSRPIPIIHTHGTSDPVVPFSGVAACLDAWITRDGCPTTEVVTDPYPENKPNSNGTKHYWGKGTDDVEIVLLELEGVGHWHSLNPNGVHTSEEIWNFCKNYSLTWGVPQFDQAYVSDDNAREIKVLFSIPIEELTSYDGFRVKVDNNDVTVENVTYGNEKQLVITLAKAIDNTNEISLSYSNGNVVSTIEKELGTLTNVLVDNILPGASPRITELSVNENGDVLIAKFNMEMELPNDLSGFVLKANYDNDITITFGQTSFENNDNTILEFSLSQTVYADYQLSLSYSGTAIETAQNGLLKSFENINVTNNAIGLPVNIVSAKVLASGTELSVDFSKPMLMQSTQLSQFSLEVNGANISLTNYSIENNIVTFTLLKNLHNADLILLSYTPGSVTSADKGALESFSAFSVENQISVPTWKTVPSKIEAEDYIMQSGIETEQTGDVDGNLNIGWIDNGDWVEYAIQNTSEQTEFDIFYRLASIYDTGLIDIYLDDAKVGQVNVPYTSGWQVYQSVESSITVPTGKHYLKLVAQQGGFNVNYFSLQKKPGTGIKKRTTGMVEIYPNPASQQITIKTGNFNTQLVEIYDSSGNMVKSFQASRSSEIQLPVSLVNGVYFIKMSNEKQYELKKIIIQN